jgi:hypothetical protein
MVNYNSDDDLQRCQCALHNATRELGAKVAAQENKTIVFRIFE